ncbi:antibiotic biosynthesis monooxygenase family protein [Sphingomonas sp. ASV193]|uniref:antibiotic biosynthesis monooxygenase family protein n=1 Tax=Sphingomonas sp. ASV193 TaxID=3144405 RepID=UPI0032E87D66
MKAQIDDAGGVFTLINTFHAPRDRQKAIVDSLRRFTEGFARTLPGFIGASVHMSLDGTRVVNYVQWKSGEDLRSMLATPEAQAHMAEVGALADRVDPVPYAVAFVGTAE